MISLVRVDAELTVMRPNHRPLVVLCLACLAGFLAGEACLDTTPPADCPQLLECTTCTMVAACSFCFETNQCIGDAQVCSGDRAQTPDMCDSE